MTKSPTSVAELSKEWVQSRSLAGIAGLNPVAAWMPLVIVLCF